MAFVALDDNDKKLDLYNFIHTDVQVSTWPVGGANSGALSDFVAPATWTGSTRYWLELKEGTTLKRNGNVAVGLDGSDGTEANPFKLIIEEAPTTNVQNHAVDSGNGGGNDSLGDPSTNGYEFPFLAFGKSGNGNTNIYMHGLNLHQQTIYGTTNPQAQLINAAHIYIQIERSEPKSFGTTANVQSVTLKIPGGFSDTGSYGGGLYQTFVLGPAEANWEYKTNAAAAGGGGGGATSDPYVTTMF